MCSFRIDLDRFERGFGFDDFLRCLYFFTLLSLTHQVIALLTQGIPARLPLRNLRGGGIALLLLVLLLALASGQRGVQQLALLLQCIALLLRLL